MELEDLYNLVDEMVNVDVAEDCELGMRVREWYQKYNADDLEFEDLGDEDMWFDNDEWE